MGIFQSSADWHVVLAAPVIHLAGLTTLELV